MGYDLKPLYPYAGGKQRSLKHIAAYLHPTEMYVEPFFGGGAVYCHMYNRRLARKYVINDIRPDIVGIYQSIQGNAVAFSDEADDLFRRYDGLSPGQQEAMFVQYRDAIAVEYNAAQCLFVRKANFGGMSKTNPDGSFDESSGHWRSPTKKVSFDRKQVCLWNQALDRTDILCGDFQNVPIGPEKSIVFCDPPYYASTVEYGSFSTTDQLRCLEWCSALAVNKSTCVLLSNRDQDRFFSKRIGIDADAVYYDIFYTSGNNVLNREALFVWNKQVPLRGRNAR